jgi:hypothetical protein
MEMNMKNVVWFTGLNSYYYDHVFSKVCDSWELLPGDVRIYSDDKIDFFKNDKRYCEVNLDFTSSKIFEDLEFKFFKKSRSILHGIRENIGKYDYAIWLDADVKIIEAPILTNLLPDDSQIISANSKIPENNTAIDTGFLAINLNHPCLNTWILEYENFWNTEEFDNLTLRYDTLVLEEIIKKNNYQWKNLWYGFMKNSKRGYCGFEDSELENYFHHFWGKYKRKLI